MSRVTTSSFSSFLLAVARVLSPAGCLCVAALGLALALALPAPVWLAVLWPVLWCVLGLVLAVTRESRRIDEILDEELRPSPSHDPDLGHAATGRVPGADSSSNPAPTPSCDSTSEDKGAAGPEDGDAPGPLTHR